MQLRGNVRTRVQTEKKVIGGPSPVPDSIIIYAENENVDLIVVATRGRSGFKKSLAWKCSIKGCNLCTLSCTCSKVNMKLKLN